MESSSIASQEGVPSFSSIAFACCMRDTPLQSNFASHRRVNALTLTCMYIKGCGGGYSYTLT